MKLTDHIRRDARLHLSTFDFLRGTANTRISKNTIPRTNQLTSPCNTDITANAEMRSCPDKLDVANVRDRKPR